MKNSKRGIHFKFGPVEFTKIGAIWILNIFKLSACGIGRQWRIG
jgi:hypothetical protein